MLVTFAKQLTTKEEENTDLILLKLDGFAVDNVVGLYRTFKLEENETALYQAKKIIKNRDQFYSKF